MSKAINTFGNGSTVIPADPNPNIASPRSERQFQAPILFPFSTKMGTELFAEAAGGVAITLQMWIYDKYMGRWLSDGTTIGVFADQIQTFASPVPSAALCFVQVVGNLAVTKVAIGYEDED
jgi:hypothetical protein